MGSKKRCQGDGLQGARCVVADSFNKQTPVIFETALLDPQQQQPLAEPTKVAYKSHRLIQRLSLALVLHMHRNSQRESMSALSELET